MTYRIQTTGRTGLLVAAVLVCTQATTAVALPSEQTRPVWEQVCSKEDTSPLPREAVFCRLLPTSPGSSEGTTQHPPSVLSECYGPGTRYAVPLDTELSQITWLTPLARPVSYGSPPTHTMTLPIDRRYLCHRIQRKVAFGEYSLDQGAEIVAALTRLRSYIGPDALLRLPPSALNYVQKSMALQLKRSLSDDELRNSTVKSFRTIHPVRPLQSKEKWRSQEDLNL